MNTLRWSSATMCLAGLVMLAGVRSGASDEGHAHTPSAQELLKSAQTVQSAVTQAAQSLQELDRRLSDAGKSIAAFQAAAAVHVLDRTAGVPEPPEGKVALHLGFQYQTSPLPGRGLEVYEAAPLASLWAMEALPAGQAVPRGALLKNNTLILSPGEARLVTIVYDNPTPRDVGFLVLPHQESPGSLGPHTWLTCLCMAFVYEAPARGSWYRVIQVKVSPDMPAGSRVDVLWTVLTDSAVFPTD